ncbi:hypothetical protein Stok01_00684 [Sulfurisphaera tokodaii]
MLFSIGTIPIELSVMLLNTSVIVLFGILSPSKISATSLVKLPLGPK